MKEDLTSIQIDGLIKKSVSIKINLRKIINLFKKKNK